ncbi:MAG: Type 1 glutamine amidotransferase-like domain-containing protein [Clostridium sp.]|nr:Type 1 glutamine amidotransferase-like domain-containing protein [Clostridium sp.]
MIVLCSNGLSSKALIEKMKEHIAGLSTAVIVVTADNEYKERNYHIPRCREELAQLGLTTSVIDIDVESAEHLLNYDVIEFIGGNPFYLTDSIRKTQAEGILRTVSKEKILIGWSAAAFVFGPSLYLVNEYTPEMNMVEIKDLSGLQLTNAEVLPHYNRFTSRFAHFEERCAAYEKKYHTNVIRLNDGDGLFIEGKNQLLIRA